VFALFKEVKQKKREKRPKVLDEDSDEDETDVVTVAPSIISRSATQNTAATSSRVSQLLDDMVIDDESVATTRPSTRKSAITIEEEPQGPSSSFPALEGTRFDQFKQQLFAVKRAHDTGDSIPLNDLVAFINDGPIKFKRGEVLATVRDMSDKNTGVWYQEEVEGMVFI
jgi:hypothetical protein